MACKYCFAQQGNYGGQQAVMDFAVAKDAVDLLMESSSSWADIDFSVVSRLLLGTPLSKP